MAILVNFKKWQHFIAVAFRRIWYGLRVLFINEASHNLISPAKV